MENEIVNQLIANNGEDMITSQMQGMMHEAYNDHFIRDFIEAFEDTKRKKTSKRKAKEISNADAIASAT